MRESSTRKLLYLQSVSIPVGQQSWSLNHWLWYYFYWFSWKTGLFWVAKMSFFFLPVLFWDNTPQLGTTPSSLQSTTIVGTVSGTPGSQEIALLAAGFNWFLRFSLRPSWICATAIFPAEPVLAASSRSGPCFLFWSLQNEVPGPVFN